jgi:type II secretory pathway pseudopilin PulG
VAVAQTATIRRKARPSGSSGRRGVSPRLHLGRLALLALILIGAAFYVAPLRQFFAQQDRYQRASAALSAARAQNRSYKVEVEQLSTKSYVAQLARTDSLLVPPNTQVFVVKGLPGSDPVAVGDTTTPTEGSISVLDRIEDLWRTLSH